MKVKFISIDTPHMNIPSFKNNKQIVYRKGKPCIITNLKLKKKMEVMHLLLQFSTTSEFQEIDDETLTILQHQLTTAWLAPESCLMTIVKQFKDKLSDSRKSNLERKDLTSS